MKNVIRIMATENKPLIISSPIFIPFGSDLYIQEGTTIINCNADDIVINKSSKKNYKSIH